LKAEIFSIGTELLMGELTDTNASWIAARLPALGIQLQWVSIIGDDREHLSEAFQRGLQRSDLIFTTGGLGPTQDDLTREAIADALGQTPVVQEEVVERLREYFQARGTEMPSHNIKQALLIPSASFVPNRNGTAPGWWAERDGKTIACMPGPPAEMQAIWLEELEPRLRQMINDEVTITRNIKTLGLSEGAVDEVISEFFGNHNPYLGIYSKPDGIHLRIIARAREEAAARKLVEPVERAIVSRLAPYIWGYDDETPEQAVASIFNERNLTLATMESCTGGYLANSITESPNSGAFFKGGVVVSSPNALATHGVAESITREHGAVSQKTANAMAQAIKHKLGADFGIGVTGVPGPEELEDKPLGLAYIAIVGGGDTRELELWLPPRRLVIKRRVSNTALIELRRMVTATTAVAG
jgi:nicotinamide-nucleotide amidase